MSLSSILLAVLAVLALKVVFATNRAGPWPPWGDDDMPLGAMWRWLWWTWLVHFGLALAAEVAGPTLNNVEFKDSLLKGVLFGGGLVALVRLYQRFAWEPDRRPRWTTFECFWFGTMFGAGFPDLAKILSIISRAET